MTAMGPSLLHCSHCAVAAAQSVSVASASAHAAAAGAAAVAAAAEAAADVPPLILGVLEFRCRLILQILAQDNPTAA